MVATVAAAWRAGGSLAAEETSTLVATETAAVILLAIAAGVAVVASRIRFPYTVALVIAGFGAAALGEVVSIGEISPELILALLVPPLLFEATLHLAWGKLKADLIPVLLFALVGTAAGTLIIGALVNASLGLPWAAALAFGALISATDPVAVIAFFKALGAPKRLSVLVEGESLFNDAVAVVAFGLAIDAASGDEAFSGLDALTQFLTVSAGGLVIGLVLGYLVSSVFLARVDDPLIETSTTLALAYGSFLLAEEFGLLIDQPDFHFSGILAVVAAGLMVGNLGFTNTSPSTRLTLEHFWELLTFLVNSLVFLLIGLRITVDVLLGHLGAVAIGVAAVLVLRVILIHGLALVAAALQPSRRISPEFRNVMIWAGLRGAISLALVLTITEEHFDADTRDTLQAMTFGVVLFTLLIQGTTIAGYMRGLGLVGRADSELVQQRYQARIHMARAGQKELRRLGDEGVVFSDLADSLATIYERDARDHAAGLRTHFGRNPELEVAMLLQARREALTAERTALTDILRTGMIETSVAEDLSVELSNRLAVLDLLEERWESDPVPTFEREGDHG